MRAYDVAIVGGGVTGAGILRDCALRGLRAVLFEKSEPGCATTAASSHLIHGGLRYLLYDRLTTHATAWDSGNIVRLAGPLVRRLPILWPIYRGQAHGVEVVETLLECYDGFQKMKLGLPHLRLGPDETLALVPGLSPRGLIGSLSFDEWWVDAVGLVDATIASARLHGGETRARTRVLEFLRAENCVRGVRVRSSSGAEEDVEAGVVINASGPWVDQVARLAGLRIPLRLRQGTHLVYDRPLSPVGLLLEALDHGRYIFVLPYSGGTLVGPTDLDCANDPDELISSKDELLYLKESARRYLPSMPEHSSTVVGARPILGQGGPEKLLSRAYEIIDHEKTGVPGLISAAGGKMSDFRLMAKDATDLACYKLGRNDPCRTARLDLKENSLPEPPDFPKPSAFAENLLHGNPRLREAHAWAHLAGAYARHWVRRSLGRAPWATPEQFRRHYGPETVDPPPKSTGKK